MLSHLHEKGNSQQINSTEPVILINLNNGNLAIEIESFRPSPGQVLVEELSMGNRHPERQHKPS